MSPPSPPGPAARPATVAVIVQPAWVSAAGAGDEAAEPSLPVAAASTKATTAAGVAVLPLLGLLCFVPARAAQPLSETAVESVLEPTVALARARAPVASALLRAHRTASPYPLPELPLTASHRAPDQPSAPSRGECSPAHSSTSARSRRGPP